MKCQNSKVLCKFVCESKVSEEKFNIMDEVKYNKSGSLLTIEGGDNRSSKSKGTQIS